MQKWQILFFLTFLGGSWSLSWDFVFWVSLCCDCRDDPDQMSMPFDLLLVLINTDAGDPSNNVCPMEAEEKEQ